MSLLPTELCPRTVTSPLDCMLYRTFNNALRDFDRSLNTVAPYWLRMPNIYECNIGNTVGKIMNDDKKFGVEIDVRQFRPDELKVNLLEKELVIEGRHEERTDEAGRIERHFVRRYAVPNDVNLDTLESHLSDSGILTIWAKKLSLEGKHVRTIPITAAPQRKRHLEHTEEETKTKK